MGGGSAGQQIIEGTLTVLLLAWVLTHAKEFGLIIGSIGGVFTGAVQALQPK